MKSAVLVAHEPGMDFAEGFPIGNGRIGVMCFGGPSRLVFVINHYDLYWRTSAKPRLRRGLWTRVRKLFRQQQWARLHELTRTAFHAWGRQELGSFQPAAILEVWPELADGATEYRRELDCRNRVARMDCRVGRTRFTVTAETAIDEPEAAIVLRTTDPVGLRARVRLYRPGDPRFPEPRTEARPHRLRLIHEWPDEQTRYEVDLRVADGGRIERRSLSIATFKPPAFGGHVPTVNHPDATAHAEAQGIARAENGRLKLLVTVDVHHHRGIRVLNPVRPARKRNGVGSSLARADVTITGGSPDDRAAPAHYQKLFHVGRYLFTSATFPGGWPPNLQGLWNDRTHPICNSDWHLDLNTQMVLWHIPTGNLLEYHEPFFRLVERMLPGARENARCLFNMRGAAFPVCTVGNGEGLEYLDSWVGTSGWILNHFHTHWRYTRDRDFLRDRYYPILRDVCRFYLDYLQEENGRLVIYPSQSPENRIPPRANSFHGKNSTFDLAIFRDVLEQIIAVARELGRAGDDVAIEAGAALPRLAEFPLAADGRLREMEDFEFTRAHRHLSHLYPVFPSERITEYTPRLQRAAQLALQAFRKWPVTGQAEWFARIGYGALAGWTYPLLACTYARLGDGNEALAMLERFSRGFRWPSGLARCFEEFDLGYGIHASPDVGKWIEIDSPLGTVAAIQEMLLQSHDGVMRLLPALPRTWHEGAFRGLRAQGGFEVDAEWGQDRLQCATIQSLLGEPCTLKLPGNGSYRVRSGSNIVEQRHDARRRTVTFATRRDRRYEIAIVT